VGSESHLVIGLTGNIATGKSTVAQMLAEWGAEAIDADKVAHEVMRAGTDVHARIVDAFGQEVVGEGGEIDRHALGQIVFSDPQALRQLEAIVHPATCEAIWARVAASEAEAVVIEAIKLIEAGLAERCDAVWVTICPQAVQIERLTRMRQMARAEARRRVAAQPPQAEKVARADEVIHTDVPLEETRAQVRTAWQKLIGHLG